MKLFEIYLRIQGFNLFTKIKPIFKKEFWKKLKNH